MKEDTDTYYFIPREGSEIWLDNMGVTSKAPHRDMAEKFINYILDAKIGAQLSNFNQYPTPNKAAMEFINPEDLKNPAIYPPPEVLKNLEFVKDLGAAAVGTTNSGPRSSRSKTDGRDLTPTVLVQDSGPFIVGRGNVLVADGHVQSRSGPVYNLKDRFGRPKVLSP